MIWSSVQPPIPVWRSGVMFVEYTVPKVPSYLRPPLLSGRSFSVWHPQPPVAPKTYFPRATGSEVAGPCAPAGDTASPPTRIPRSAVAPRPSHHRRNRRGADMSLCIRTRQPVDGFRPVGDSA